MPKASKSSIKRSNDVNHNDCTQICPVPIIVCQGKEDQSGEKPVRMYCTNHGCAVSKKPIHGKCFKKLEDSIVKSLRTGGSSRLWSSEMCRENLWTRRTRFIDKLLKCKCGKGQLYRQEEDAVKFQGVQSSTTIPTQKEHNKRPKLNVSNVHYAADKKRIGQLNHHFLNDHSGDIMLENPNPTTKIQLIKNKPVAHQNINTTCNNQMEKSVPEWIQKIQTKAEGCSDHVLKREIIKKANEIFYLSRSRCTSQQSEIRTPVSLVSFDMSPKSSVDLGVGSSLSSSPSSLNSSFDSEETIEHQYIASERFMSALEGILSDDTLNQIGDIQVHFFLQTKTLY